METKKKLRKDIERMRGRISDLQGNDRVTRGQIHIEACTTADTLNVHYGPMVPLKDVITEILSHLNLGIIELKDNKNFALKPIKKREEKKIDGRKAGDQKRKV